MSAARSTTPRPNAAAKRPAKAARWYNDQYAAALSHEYSELSKELVKQELPPAIKQALKDGPNSDSAWLFDEMLKP